MPSSRPRLKDLKLCSLLVLLSVLAFLPVLLNPHWGLFDDAGLILQPCRSAQTDMASFVKHLSHIWRPGLFFWVLILWQFSPDNPLGFYLANCAIFAATTVLTYKIAKQISRSCLLSFLAALGWFFTPSTFEVIYCLDKQEEYLPLLINIVLWAYLKVDDAMARNKCGLVGKMAALVLILAALLAGLLSKETMQILLVPAGLFALARLLPYLSAGKPYQRRLDSRATWALTFGGVTFAAWLWYRLAYGDMGQQSGYIKLNFDPLHLLTKLKDHFASLPEFFVLLTLVLSGLFLTINRRRIVRKSTSWQTATILALAGMCGTIAMLTFSTFDSPLNYIWLPLHAFALPAAAYYFQRIGAVLGQRFRHAPQAVAVSACLLLLTQVPDQFLRAQFQFQMDSLTHDLAKKVAALYVENGKKPIKVAMPYVTIGASEIAERIEYFSRDELEPHHIDSPTEQLTDYPITFFNYLEYSKLPDPQSRRGQAEPLMNRAMELQCINDLASDYVGLVGFCDRSGVHARDCWTKSAFGKGDWLLVPYGEIPYQRILFRGSGEFSQPGWIHTRFLPFLQMTEVFSVQRKIRSIYGHGAAMGWQCFHVDESPAISIAFDPAGWIENNCPTIFSRALLNKTIRLRTEAKFASPILFQGQANGGARNTSGQLTVSKIRRPGGGENDTETWFTLPLTCNECTPQESDVFALKLTSPHAITAPHAATQVLLQVREAVVEAGSAVAHDSSHVRIDSGTSLESPANSSLHAH